MARVDTLKNFLTDIADKFREKLGTTELIEHADYDTKIDEVYEKGLSDAECTEYHLSDITNWNYFFAQNIRQDLARQITPDTTSKGTTFASCFVKCTNTSFTEPPFINTGKGITFTSMYSDCSSMIKMALIDTSNGEIFSYFLQECSKLQEMPFLNTSKGKKFDYFYKNCKALQDFPNLDTSNGENFNCMYYGCESMVNAPEQDTSNGLNFRRMYYGCSNLVTIPKLDLGKATEEEEVLKGCTSLTDINFVSVNYLSGYTMYLDVSDCTQLTRASLLSLLNALKKTPSSTYQPRVRMGDVNKAKLTDEELKIATDKGWSVI